MRIITALNYSLLKLCAVPLLYSPIPQYEKPTKDMLTAKAAALKRVRLDVRQKHV